MTSDPNSEIAFYDQLRFYYSHNKKKIRSRYNALTRKFLSYNDPDENENAFLRRPQFEALEMYVFIKEFLDNKQVFEIFDDWRNRRERFSDTSIYTTHKDGQTTLFEKDAEKLTDSLFRKMKQYKENYSNYIYALAMGLGKTILMAVCIFYEFLLARKYPNDKRFCHNALVFAPDKTVLESLREIVLLDKNKIVPPEYVPMLDSEIKFHFLDDSGTLNTIDDSMYNIIISNTQKIIVKKKHAVDRPAKLFFEKGSLLSDIYGEISDEDLRNADNISVNQRFIKLCRLNQLGIYVDEAHHMFGADLDRSIHDKKNETSLRTTINMLAENLVKNGSRVVACHNYTGTPYVRGQVLPEVVYAYGLKQSIRSKYLKNCDVLGFDNVKNEEFLRAAITKFWESYGGKTFEDLTPKLAIFSSTIDEAENEVRPAVENILRDIGIPLSNVLVNVGDPKITPEENIRHFNNLDKAGTEGNKKQFLILVNKGREGWNCRSLFGVALYRSPKSKVFVLQATMRCLRKITDEQQTATVFLSKENMDILTDELTMNFNMEIKDMKSSDSRKYERIEVRRLKDIRVKLKIPSHEYSLLEREHATPINFELEKVDTSKYEATIYEKTGIISEMSIKEANADGYREMIRYNHFTLIGEISRYLNISPILINDILKESVDGPDKILEMVNKYNEILWNVIVPGIFSLLYEIKHEVKSEEREIELLREPHDLPYYLFPANKDLMVRLGDGTLNEKEESRTFHADTYCFDSKPERECFWQYVSDNGVAEIYFTGMFRNDLTDLSIQYYDPETERIRKYYPDFFAKMSDGTYRILEVKGDHMIDTEIVRIKQAAAREVAVESKIEYIMYPASFVMKNNVLTIDTVRDFRT